MKILSLNSGSSSLKFQLFESGNPPTLLAKGLFDELNTASCKFIFDSPQKKFEHKLRIKNLKEAVDICLFTLKEAKIIESLKEIKAVGHRVVHGGEIYKEPTLITGKVTKNIKSLSKFAPLHNPANLNGIKATQYFLKKIPQVAVFDTTFHQNMDKKAFLYGLPYSLYEKYGIRRYGFHGLSHEYVTDQVLKKLGNKNAKIVSCHLGNGSSITASKGGESIDTSMGFTPLEGVLMGTRSGTIDPFLVIYLQKKLSLSKEKTYKLLNEKSGLLGISEISSDMRLIYAESLKGNPRANLAIEMLSYQSAKYIGAYAAALNGLNAIVFTAGLGEKAFYVRKKICSHFEFLGLQIDNTKNKNNEELISTPSSKIAVFVIHTDEEIKIAIETQKFLES